MADGQNPLPDNPCDSDPFLIGEWLVEPALNRMKRCEESVQIEPRIMHVLVCLADRAGQAVSRSALLDAVWGEVIVNEEALTHAVSQLRRVLGDDPRQPEFIQTIHKTGYRLIAPVTPWRPEPVTDADHEVSDPVPADRTHEPYERKASPRKRLVAILGSLVVTVVIISVLVIISRSRPTSPPAPVALEEIPFTSYPGREICPAISPDGSRIVFSWDESGENRYDLYVKQRNTETSLRLTDTEGDEYYAVWSPDGSEVAYVFDEAGGAAIYVIPSIGGAPRKVVERPYGVYGIDWSPDGRHLVFGSRQASGEPIQIVLFSFDTRECRVLTNPAAFSRGDYRPAFSPDGTEIAFIRGDRTNLLDIFIVPVTGGEPDRITHSQHYIAGLDWTPDGEALVFCSGPTRAGDMRLWRLSRSTGTITWLPTVARRPIRPSIALNGTMVYESQSVNSDILTIEVAETDKEPSAIIASTRHDYGPQYSPGGKYISFISNRSGSPQIWVCEQDGCNPRQLTRFESAYIENHRWAYDERRIAFSAAPGNTFAIYIADVETGEVWSLSDLNRSTSARHQMCLGWSRDGRSLYCKSDRDDGWWVWKIRVDRGPGESVTVDIMQKDVFRLAESVDGKHLTYSRADTSGVWQALLDGTDEQCVINEPGTVVPCGWREAEAGIYFFCFGEGTLNLCFHDSETGEATRLASGGNFFAINIDVAPAGDAVVFDRLEPIGSDLVVVGGLPR
jgi:Tol biopolymer transport system component/DNA-binding winged helix-turn-helix (wHTH) protein